MGTRTFQGLIVEERPLCGMQCQQQAGNGKYLEAPLPGDVINLAGPGGKLDYTPTDRGHPAPLTLAACHPGWDNYFDLTETVTEMAHHLMKEDGQEVAMPPKASTTQGGHSRLRGICE